ncbi:MAG TPA: hypothetical protein VHF25_05645 [Nitriliruptorales bacterium]|nr:hypothetical protein [Nitriliruptorales bacterium]
MRTIVRTACVVALVAAFGTGGAVPAAALHQQCSGYTPSSLGNGHPHPSFGGASFSGVHDEYIAGAVELGLESAALVADHVSKNLELQSQSVDVAGTGGEGFATAAVVANNVAFGLKEAQQIVKIVLYDLANDNNRANACNDTMHGDMIDSLFAALMHQDLLASTPPNALFMLPNGYDPSIPDGSAPGFFDGFITEFGADLGTQVPSDFNVKDLVHHTKERLVATGQSYNSAADTYIAAADGQLEKKQYKAAYKNYRLAYRYLVQ